MSQDSHAAYIGLLLAVVATNASAVLPPKYLAVEDFKQCLATREISTYRVLCMPSEKPESCPETSWGELKALSQGDKLPDCPATSNGEKPPPAEKPSNKQVV